MNELRYFTPQAIELDDIRAIAEKNYYKCTSYKLVLEDGTDAHRLNIHFRYEEDGESGESYWQWVGGTEYGFDSFKDDLDSEDVEAWRKTLFMERQPASGFVIGYQLFSLPYFAQFMIQVLKQYSGWVEDSFSDTQYTLSTIDDLPINTARYLQSLLDDAESDADD